MNLAICKQTLRGFILYHVYWTILVVAYVYYINPFIYTHITWNFIYPKNSLYISLLHKMKSYTFCLNTRVKHQKVKIPEIFSQLEHLFPHLNPGLQCQPLKIYSTLLKFSLLSYVTHQSIFRAILRKECKIIMQLLLFPHL